MRVLTLFTALTLTACNDADQGAASGTSTSRTFDLTDFTGVELAASDNVDVRVGPGFSVRAEGPGEHLDQLVITKRGSTLSIGRESQVRFTASKSADAKVFVTMPSIATASVSGAGTLHLDTVSGAAFSARLTGSGDLSIEAVSSTSIQLDVSGSGNIAVQGAVERASMSVTGSGNINGTGFAAAGADVSVSGSGNVNATVNGAATVSVSGSGNVTLKGATCTTSATGTGTVHCG